MSGKGAGKMRRLSWLWLGLVVLLCLLGAFCRGSGSAVPTEVEIDWPDAAPYQLEAPAPDRKEPDAESAGPKEPRQYRFSAASNFGAFDVDRI
ncbi:MAG: hypothetical protein MJE77_28080 [Proteobacteria bacterium]|nr:hypothetical protein [Pseudomonadota bacterium]